MSRRYLLITLILLVVGSLALGIFPGDKVLAADNWVSPTSHYDPDSKWTNETSAYNDNTNDLSLIHI